MYTILLGILLVGEEAALLIGTRVMNKNTNPWNSQKNSLFLYLDILCGAILLLSVILKFPEVIF